MTDQRGARRVSVERNIYRRPSGAYEVGYRDAGGKQRWRKVEGGITAARPSVMSCSPARLVGSA